MFFESHFGVYALILHPADGSVLLIKKVLGCYTGLYDLPGGGMEPQEVLEEALKREVLEETGCIVTFAEQLETFSLLYPHHKNGRETVLRHIGCVYQATISGTPRETPAAADDSGGCLWISPEEITAGNAAPFVSLALQSYTRRSRT